MNDPMGNGYARSIAITAICCAALSLVPGLATPFAATPVSAASLQMASPGERIYREGALPSGAPLQATLKTGLSVPGTSFACVSCHLRSGLGTLDGELPTPAANGAKIFQPFRAYSAPTFSKTQFVPREIVLENQKYIPKSPNRPPYTDASLAHVIRHGVDSAGRTLNDAMPRFLLADEDMKLLLSYLKSLSSQYSPGVSDTTIRFATVSSADVSPEELTAMLAPLQNYVSSRNATYFADHDGGVLGARSRLMAVTKFTPKGVKARKLALSHWVLKGPPETWRSQLEEYYRKEPVFALLGGLTSGEWQPIHQFCEENHIPDIFPITSFPVISQTDWYTLYLSKGYYQEGEGAARFLDESCQLTGKPVVQIVRDSREAQALARGFVDCWRELGQDAPVTITLKAGETLSAERLRRELPQDKPAAIVLWDGPEALKTLEPLAADKTTPALVLVSSTLLGKSMLSLDEQAREFTYLTYPYAMPPQPQDKSAPWMGTNNFNAQANAVASTRISQQSYILTLIMDMALLNMRGEYYRDNLLDVIGTIMNQDVPLYGRLSFGAGQRYASRGCYIVQLGKTGLLKKTGWVTP